MVVVVRSTYPAYSTVLLYILPINLNGIAVDYPALFMLRQYLQKTKALFKKSRRNCVVAFVIGSGYPTYLNLYSALHTI